MLKLNATLGLMQLLEASERFHQNVAEHLHFFNSELFYYSSLHK